jgi:hypothetical protein
MRTLNEKYLFELFDHIKVRFKPLESIKPLKDNSFLLVEIITPPNDSVEEWIVVFNDELLETERISPAFDTGRYDVLTMYYGPTPGTDMVLPRNISMSNLKNIIVMNRFFKDVDYKINIYHIDDEDLYLQVLNYTQLITLESN